MYHQILILAAVVSSSNTAGNWCQKTGELVDLHVSLFLLKALLIMSNVNFTFNMEYDHKPPGSRQEILIYLRCSD